MLKKKKIKFFLYNEKTDSVCLAGSFRGRLTARRNGGARRPRPRVPRRLAGPAKRSKGNTKVDAQKKKVTTKLNINNRKIEKEYEHLKCVCVGELCYIVYLHHFFLWLVRTCCDHKKINAA